MVFLGVILLMMITPGSDNPTNLSVPHQPEKDLPRHPTAADGHLNIGTEL